MSEKGTQRLASSTPLMHMQVACHCCPSACNWPGLPPVTQYYSLNMTFLLHHIYRSSNRALARPFKESDLSSRARSRHCLSGKLCFTVRVSSACACAGSNNGLQKNFQVIEEVLNSFEPVTKAGSGAGPSKQARACPLGNARQQLVACVFLDLRGRTSFHLIDVPEELAYLLCRQLAA